MEIFLTAAIPSAPAFLKIAASNTKTPKARAAVCCLGLEGHENSKTSEEMLQSTESMPEAKKKHNDIWQLFREAQQNILYLNKQRMIALEELDEMKKEKKLLLNKIEQLEMKKAAQPLEKVIIP
ncbi:UDP-Glycosyltransferase superfamily protein [Actinidia rufa]|uniref:UDP-Glycosyltransferase superfamily protein n=1 Tax=Actinidia rufa TaxID=165716 RepID=A0A7J0EJR1_9ERIC|nr:UDP-Glycosyltransferase superfamily protein [Actinidia rufa]